MHSNAVYDWLLKAVLGMGGAVLAWLEPMQEIMYVVFASLVVDTATAYLLNRRVAQKFKGMSHGKLQSKRLLNLFKTLIAVLTVMLLAYAIDRYCFTMMDLHLANMIAFAFCMIQLVSVLENISSCNDAKWAKLLQKILIDKTSRHLDYNVGDYIKEIAEEKVEEAQNKKKATNKNRPRDEKGRYCKRA